MTRFDRRARYSVGSNLTRFGPGRATGKVTVKVLPTPISLSTVNWP